MSKTTDLDPSRSALLLMDYQPVVVAQLGADATIAPAAAARATADSLGIQVAYVRVAFTPQDFASISTRNRTFGPMQGGGFLVDGSPEAEVVEALAPKDGDIVVRKTRLGAFSTTNLVQQLRSRDIDTLFLAGISTGGVVLSTVRDAADRDFRLFVLSDCCFDPNDAVHSALINGVFPVSAQITTSGEFAGLFA